MSIKSTIYGKIIIVLTILTVLFIFIQSMIPKEESKKESDAVGEVVEQVIETVAPDNESFKDAVKKDIRKIAHFFEFGVLGSEVALYLFLSYRKRNTILDNIDIPWRLNYLLKSIAVCLASGLLVSIADETIQIFSERGPSVTDVWIDMFGFSSLYFLLITILLSVYSITRNKRQKSICENT